MTTRFFGLDGEMSSSDTETGGRLIQIGVTAHFEDDGSVAPGTEAFTRLINPGPCEWAPVAEAVHGYTAGDVARAMPAEEVDSQLSAWLVMQGAQRRHRANTVPVGFNVGAFDMPHLSLVLPRAASFFSRRTVDLNAVCFTLDGARHEGAQTSADEWRALASLYAERMIFALTASPLPPKKWGQPPVETHAHNAGYDALLHLHAWRFLRSVTHGAPLTIPETPAPAPESKTWSLALIEAHGVTHTVALTGVPEPFVVQWSRGGRAVNETYLHALETAYAQLSP